MIENMARHRMPKSERQAWRQDRRQKVKEYADGAGVWALVWGIPIGAAVGLVVLLDWWLG